jgi:hypothetical protein
MLAIAIAAVFWPLFALPAAAHRTHGHYDLVAAQTVLVDAAKGIGAALSKRDVASAYSHAASFSCCASCSTSAGCCGSGASTPCGYGACGAGLLLNASIAGIRLEPMRIRIGSGDQQLAGRAVEPLDKPPRA